MPAGSKQAEKYSTDKRIPKLQKCTNMSNSFKYNRVNPMFMLSFEYSTGYSDDLIQMAYSVPYTYTQLT